MIFYLYVAAFIIGAGVHLALAPKPRSAHRVVEIILLYLLVVFVGVGGLMAAYAHTFRAAETARYIGWPPGSPFQFEIAMANLAMGVLGLLCIWRREAFWLATGLASATFGFGVAYGHVVQMMRHGNYAPGNVGPVLWLSDTTVPLAILILLWLRHRLARRDKKV